MGNDYSAMIYTTEQVRKGEREAAIACDVSMTQLMQRAAQACLRAIQAQHPAPARILVLCGSGNNGGDGWVLARLAQQAGYRVHVFALPAKTELTIAAKAAWFELGGQAESLEQLSARDFDRVDLVVDALFGSGLSRALEPALVDVIQVLNRKAEQQRLWVLSIDVPSGLNSDSGQPWPVAVRAHKTVTMVAVKVGLVTGQAANFCGDLELADLGIAAAFYQQKPTLKSINQNLVSECLPPRDPASHKGHYGHVVIVGGGPGMSGAVVLAGLSALRCGAGKVSVVTHPQTQLAVASQYPELMVHGVLEFNDSQFQNLLAQASVVVVGPGLGQSPWAQDWVRAMAQWHGSVVWDADGLNGLALQVQQSEPMIKPEAATWYLTPHPAEAGRLLQQSTIEIEANRLAALTQICQNFQAHVLLKGAGTLIQAPTNDLRWVCRRGSAALATAGSGDVLTGVVAALVAQSLAPVHVLPVAAYLHAVAGERAARSGERGTIASDIVAELRALVNPRQALEHLLEH